MSLKEKALIVGMLNAVGVFFLGFFVLFIMWEIGEYPKSLRGFFYYKAATVGDGICLPGMIFSLATFNYYYGNLRSVDVKKFRFLGGIAAIVGALVQISWLMNPNIVVNWTIPRVGHFNVAGWYHAIFFSGMVGLTIYYIWCFAYIVYSKEIENSLFEKQLLFEFVTFGTTYVLLHFGDDYGKSIGYIPLFCIIIVILFIALVGVGILMKKAELNYIAMIMMGLLLAFGVATWIFIKPQGGQFWVSMGGALCACLLWKEEKVEQLISTTLETIIAVFMCLYVATATDIFAYQVAILSILVVTSIIIDYVNYSGVQWHFLPLIVVSLYILRSVVLNPISTIVLEKQIGSVMDILFYAAFFILFQKEIVNRFAYVESAEVKKNTGEIGEEEFGVQKGISYANIILVVIGIFCVLLQWLTDIATKSSTAGVTNGDVVSGVGEFIGIVVCLLYIISVVIRKKRQGIDRFLVPMAAIIIYFLISFFEIKSIGMELHSLLEMSNYQLFLFAISGFAVLGYPILLSEGYYMNLVILRGNKENKDVKIMSVVILIGGEFVSVSNMLVLLYDLSYMGIIKLIISTSIVCMILPVILGLSQKVKCEKSHVVPDTWMGGVLQDGLSASLVQILLIAVPCFYIGILDIKTDLNGWIAILGLVILDMGVVGFFINNNVKHVERQRGVLKEYPEERTTWIALRKSLIKQNEITIIMTLPYFLLRVIADSAGMVLHKKDFDDDNRIYRQLMSKYIDMQRYRESFEGKDGRRKYCFDVEEQIMELDEIVDCTVTKLEKNDERKRNYIGVFVILNENISVETALDKIDKNVPVFVDSKKYVEVIKPVENFYNERGVRDIYCLKHDVNGFYDRYGKGINIG